MTDEIVGERIRSKIDEWNSVEPTNELVTGYKDYQKYIGRKWSFTFLFILAAIVVVGIAMSYGSSMGFKESYSVLWHHITGDIIDPDKDGILIELRMPRIVIGLIAGAGLAVAGVVMQSTLNNPLADPYTTGVSSGAGFGATMAITLGSSLALSESTTIVVYAFVFSLIPTAVIVAVSKIRGASPTMMIMSGIAVMYIFNACTTVLMLWSNPNDMQAVYLWTVGALTHHGWECVPVLFTATFVGLVLMFALSRKLNVLATGDDNANAMGLNANNLRILNMIVVALVSAAIVSFTGMIGFVGLVAPHIVRLFIGADNRYLMPASAAFGAFILVAADLVGRWVIAPSVLPVGVVTSFMGGPIFLWLLMRRKGKIWG